MWVHLHIIHYCLSKASPTPEPLRTPQSVYLSLLGNDLNKIFRTLKQLYIQLFWETTLYCVQISTMILYSLKWTLCCILIASVNLACNVFVGRLFYVGQSFRGGLNKTNYRLLHQIVFFFSLSQADWIT